jgi:hypothetical protein
MKPKAFRGRGERRILVGGRWTRPEPQQALMQVFGRDAAIRVSDASIRRYQEASTLAALLS